MALVTIWIHTVKTHDWDSDRQERILVDIDYWELAIDSPAEHQYAFDRDIHYREDRALAWLA